MKLHLDQVGIITHNFDLMKKFYHEVIGLDIVFEMDGSHVEFTTGSVRFAISAAKVMLDTTGHEGYNNQSHDELSFELAFKVDTPEEVDTTFKELIAKGAEEIKAPKNLPRGQRAGFFADPDGNVHEVFADLSPDLSKE